jgi:hypothetical protein
MGGLRQPQSCVLYAEGQERPHLLGWNAGRDGQKQKQPQNIVSKQAHINLSWVKEFVWPLELVHVFCFTTSTSIT